MTWLLLARGFVRAFYDGAFPNTDTNESRGWSQFAWLTVSPWIGFVPGGIYGIVRARRAKPTG